MNDPSAVRSMPVSGGRVPPYRRLYVQVLVAIAAGVSLGAAYPDLAQQAKPFGDLFIRLIRLMVAPVIFTTVSVGIARMGDLKDIARVGIKSLVYFEVVSTVALVLGFVIANLYKPGHGIALDATSPDRVAVGGTVARVTDPSAVEGFLKFIPDSVTGAFAAGQTLQVLVLAVLVGLGLVVTGNRSRAVIDGLEHVSEALFGVVRVIMWVAPLGAFGAMAFTVGKYGVGTLHQLALLMAGVYTTSLLFIVAVLGTIARAAGFSLWRFLLYIRDEIVLVLGTSTSESALPRLMLKLEQLGCARPVVGLVVPTGYSFNLDGTSIYLSMAVLFIAQAAHVELSWGQQLGVMGVLLLTSKGAAAVAGGGFITLAATLSSFPEIPVAGLALVLGVDRFMSEARSITNLIGNGVATVAVARWEGALDRERMARILGGVTWNRFSSGASDVDA
jgi:aerobic C4-dicarboxylate transport protein